VDAGCEFRDNQPVTRIEFDSQGAAITTPSGTLRGSVVVGADGVNGITRRAAGFAPHLRMAVALEAEMEAPSSVLESWRSVFHVDFGAIPWGYAWIFPKAEHLSVGIGHLMRKGKSRDLKAELAKYVGSEPTLEHATEMFARGHRIPLGGQNGRYHAPRALLVGDAAGVVDPFTAEGIYYAIRSGLIAGEEISSSFRRGEFDLTHYTQRINTEINSDFRYAWAAAQVFYRMPHLAFRALKRSSAVQGAATDTVVGESSYRRTIVAGLKRFAESVVRGRV
jgi:flavin-dependent dehydrogenase